MDRSPQRLCSAESSSGCDLGAPITPTATSPISPGGGRVTPNPPTASFSSHLPRCEQVAELGGTEISSSASRVAYASGPASLAACSSRVLCQTFCRASRRNRFEPAWFNGCRTRSRVGRVDTEESSASSADTRPDEDRVDPLVVALPPGEQRRPVELLGTDHRDERLRQVVVDVGVDPEQQPAQRRQVLRRREGQPPRPGDLPAGHPGLQRADVEVGERDVPPVHPRRVLEPALLDLLAHRDGRPTVGREEGPLGVEVGRHRLEQCVHPRENGGYARQLVRGQRSSTSPPRGSFSNQQRSRRGPNRQTCRPWTAHTAVRGRTRMVRLGRRWSPLRPLPGLDPVVEVVHRVGSWSHARSRGAMVRV